VSLGDLHVERGSDAPVVDGPHAEHALHDSGSDRPRVDTLHGDAACAIWSVGTWGACSTTCGTGTQDRTVTCRCGGQEVSEGDCPTPVPAKTQPCTAEATCTFSWQSSSWGTCTKTCGGGTQTRTAWCQRSDGTKVADASCTGAPPATSQACNPQLCPTTACGSMQQWRECSSTTYAAGVHGDPTSPEACAASCGYYAAGCAKWLSYGSANNVCVCHAGTGIQPSTFPFEQGNTSGYVSYAADCTGGPAIGSTGCTSASCAKTCGAMQAWQQCTGTAYFIDAIGGDNSSAAACATYCGVKGAACAKYLVAGNGTASCICHASAAIGSSTGLWAQGSSPGQIYSALCY